MTTTVTTTSYHHVSFGDMNMHNSELNDNVMNATIASILNLGAGGREFESRRPDLGFYSPTRSAGN